MHIFKDEKVCAILSGAAYLLNSIVFVYFFYEFSNSISNQKPYEIKQDYDFIVVQSLFPKIVTHCKTGKRHETLQRNRIMTVSVLQSVSLFPKIVKDKEIHISMFKLKHVCNELRPRNFVLIS